MSFALKPINPKIQRVLERKSKILSRDTTALKTVSVDTISDELKKVQSKTTWMRWISGNENPIVILGGIAHYDGAYNLAKGFDNVYVPPNTAIEYNKRRPGWAGRVASKYFKPLAGVKSISTTFEGATKSLRKTTVNWTVYDLDELETLTPHFLSPGKWTMLEMGWNYDGKTFTNLVGNKLLEDDTNFEDFSSVEDIIYDNEGDYEILTGIISNFEYSLRDDGGFDCTTTFTTHGISLLDAGKDSTTYTIDKVLTLNDPNKQNSDNKSVIIKNNLTTTVNRLDDYFRFSCTNPKNTAVLEGKHLLKITGEGTQVSNFYGEPDNWFIYTVASSILEESGKTIRESAAAVGLSVEEYKDKIGKETLRALIAKQSQSWVRWGWFEDNVLSKFMGYVTLNTDENKKITGIEDIKLQFRSIDKILKMDAKGLTIPVKSGDENIKYESVRILSHSKMITSDINKFILVGRTYTLKRAGKSDAIRASHIGKFLDFASSDKNVSKKLKPFVIEESVNSITGFEEGYLRNIYFNVNWLKEQLKGTQTLREGLDNILHGVNLEYQQFWDFDITGDENDTTIARIVDRNNPRYNVDNFSLSKIDLKNPNSPNSTYSCYQFPTWTKDSIVSNMDYSVTIPSSMVAVAALSGGTLDSNQPANAKKGDINVQQIVKIMNKSFKNQKDKFFKNIVKISDHFDNSEIEKFGNSSADENKKLESNAGPSILGTVIARDKEFTNPTGGNTKTDLAEFTEIAIKPIGGEHPYFSNPTFDQPTAEIIGGYKTLYTNTGKLQEGGSKTFKEQMLKGLHTDRRTAKTKLVDLLNGIAELKLTIDGTAGIFPGDAFTSMHLPNHLVRLSKTKTLPLIFQATNVEQALGPDGWKTTITGQPRLNSKYLYDDEEFVPPMTPEALNATQKLNYFRQTRNILGINAHFMDKYRMHHGILRVHESDPYWGTGGDPGLSGKNKDMSSWSSKEFPLIDGDNGGWRKNEEPNVFFEKRGRSGQTDRKESFYMAIYDGMSVQKAMWHSMYMAILYGIPPERAYNKVKPPYISMDKTFNLVSYFMFVSDDLDPTTPVKRYRDSGKAKAGTQIPTYHSEFFKKMMHHFKGQSMLNPTGASRYPFTNFYSPCQWMKRESLKGRENYQQLFEYARIEPFNKTYEPPGREIFNTQDITVVMKLTPTGRDIYRDFFKMLYNAWIGSEFETQVSLTVNNTNVDIPKIRDQYGAMFQNFGAGEYSKKDDPDTDQVNESDEFKFKGSNINTFNFDKEVDKFLTMMTKYGIIIAPILTMRNSPVQTTLAGHNAWDTIKATVDKHAVGKNKTQPGLDIYGKLKNPLIYKRTFDKEVKEINLEGD